jgi:hypothetical protein
MPNVQNIDEKIHDEFVLNHMDFILIEVFMPLTIEITFHPF